MKTGIIGLPQSGKTTLYNAVSRSSVDLYADSEPRIAVIQVPDPRFEHAVAVCSPKKRTPATLEITDGAARIEAAAHSRSGGRGTGDFLAGVRLMDALVLVVRAFRDAAGAATDPVRDAQQLMEELVLADQILVETRLERLEKGHLQKRESPAEAAERHALLKVLVHLEAGLALRTLEMTEDEQRCLRGFAFVSAKPLIVVANTDEGADADSPEISALSAFAGQHGAGFTALCCKLEAEIAQMNPAEEREFLEALGLAAPARDRLIREAYSALGLICFFTVGDDEVRAWTVAKGTIAVQAAEKIHSDIARGFIRAEVIAWELFEAAGGCWDDARGAGHARLEGKEYIVRDGDVMHIRFKV
ncbi:MAG: YchF family ATPase [Armatimonadetes bacterium]|nr:YchF family ATPase [Armatimonadota bacterium]MDE2207150.1 YchF family ATPase [Armatimonadota bacterium]